MTNTESQEVSESRFCLRCWLLALLPIIALGLIGWWASTQFEAGRLSALNTTDTMIEQLDDLEVRNLDLQDEVDSLRRDLAQARAVARSAEQWTFEDLVDRALALNARDRQRLLERMGVIEQGDLGVDQLLRRIAELGTSERAMFWRQAPESDGLQSWMRLIGAGGQRAWVSRLPLEDGVIENAVVIPRHGRLTADDVSSRFATMEASLLRLRRENNELRETTARPRDVEATMFSATPAAAPTSLSDAVTAAPPLERNRFFASLAERADFQRWHQNRSADPRRAYLLAFASADLRAEADRGRDAAAAVAARTIAERDRRLAAASASEALREKQILEVKRLYDIEARAARRLADRLKSANDAPREIRLPAVGLVEVSRVPALFEQARRERDASAKALEELQAALTATRETRAALSEEVERLRQDRDARRTVIAPAPVLSGEFSGEIGDIRRRLAAAIRDRDAALRELDATQARLDRLIGDDRSLVRVQERLEAARQQVETLTAARDAALADAQTARRDLETSQDRLAALRANLDGLPPVDAARDRPRESGPSLADRLRSLVGGAGDAAPEAAETVFVDDGRTLQLSASIAFASGQAALSDEGRRAVDRVAERLLTDLRERPSARWRLLVEGHTDNRPISTEQFPSNWELSAARAAAVTRRLSARGVPAERLLAVGRAAFEPVATGDDPASLAANRRIEFEIVDE